jgi:metallo-beta-lactamase family protein
MIIFTGFQARGTLGRKIVDGAQNVSIFNDKYKVRAKTYFMGGLSAHADGEDLLTYVKKIMNGKLKKVYLVHGDMDEAVPLQEKIETSNDLDVDIPQSLTQVRL